MDHKFLTPNGMVPLKDVIENKLLVDNSPSLNKRLKVIILERISEKNITN